MAESVSQRLAHWVHNLKYEDIPEEVITAAKRILLDTIACCLGGHHAHDVELAGKVFIDVGKKEEGAWKWNKAKIDDEEMGEILRVLKGETEEASFYHEFQGKTTKIWVNRKQEKVYFRIEDKSKALTPAQQAILKVLVQEAIVAVNIDTGKTQRRTTAPTPQAHHR
jgi:hypothetical protein